jgi:flagellar biosynthesis protein FlhG
MNQPKASLSDFLIDSQCDFFDLLSPTQITNLALIAGGHEARWSREMDRVTAGIHKLWQPLLASRRQLGVDCVILDLGAGAAEHTLQGFSLAHMGIMTVLAEPTSIENAYSFLKILFLKHVDQVAERTGSYVEAHKVVSTLAKIQTSGFDGGFLSTCEKMKDEFPEFMDTVLSSLNVHKLGLIVNQSRDHKDEQLGASMEMICRRYFGFNAKFYGRLGIDESAWHALRQKKLLTALHPQAPLSRSLRGISQAMLDTMAHQKEVAFGSPV